MLQQEQATFKIFCRADEGYCLTVRNNAVVLAPTENRNTSPLLYSTYSLLVLHGGMIIKNRN
jgi:hypothetical protein